MTLYRTYRPRIFAELVGRSTVTTILQNALLRQRIAHAYLFCGPRGTGKTTTARIFARALCCSNPERRTGFEPCGICEACESIERGQATDLIEIDAASNRGIEDIRTLREQALYPPSRLPYRIYIIDEAHMLTGDACNALLKTLEEPPEHCIFILATTEAHKLPLTIRSRCQIIRFERGTVQQIAEKLQTIILKEGLRVEPEVPALIAAHAEGGFRDAETLLEQLTSEEGLLTAVKVHELLGTMEQILCDQLLEATLTQDAAMVNELLTSHFSDPEKRYDWIISQLLESLRQRQSPSAGELLLLRELLEAYILLKGRPLPYLSLHIACLSAAGGSTIPAPMGKPTAQSVLQKSETSSVNVSVIPASTPVSERVPVVELRDKVMTDIRKAWKQASEEIARTNLPLAQILRQTIFHDATDSEIMIHVRYKFHTEKLTEVKNRSTVERILKELTGKSWKVTYELNQNVPKQVIRPSLTASASPTINEAMTADVFRQPSQGTTNR